MTELITQPATSIERKVKGAAAYGLVAAVLLVLARRYFSDEEMAIIGPTIGPFLIWAAAVAGGYVTKSKRPMPVIDAEPVEE